MTTVRALANKLNVSLGDMQEIFDGTDSGITGTWLDRGEQEFARAVLTDEGVADITSLVTETADSVAAKRLELAYEIADDYLTPSGIVEVFGSEARTAMAYGEVTRSTLVGMLAEAMAIEQTSRPTDRRVLDTARCALKGGRT